MPSTLLITLLLMLLTAVILAKVLNLPRNIWLLFLVQPLAMSASPVIVFIGGILSTQLAPDPSLATLPLTLMIIGIASSTIPAAMLAKKFGRKKAFNIGLSLSCVGSLIAMFAAMHASFSLFLIACLCIGSSIAFIMQFRFAAIDSVSNSDDVAKVVSVLMFAGIFAAFIGPEIALMGKDWLASPYGYAGSFLGLAIMVFISLIIFQGFTDPVAHHDHAQGEERSLITIIKQPLFIIAILAAAIGYGLMSLLMTATPLSMHNMQGMSLINTKWVIQSHIVAMYLPSLFSGLLVKRIGLKNVLLLGIILFVGVTIIALNGQYLMHYWWTLVLLGIGWNFLFLTGTVLLAKCYRAVERYKVQAINDFIIFTVQALASLLAGWILFKGGWDILVYSTMPFILLIFIANMFFYRLNYAK
ncbi:MAG: MFS transporter [Alteromonadaceae bacterium]|nr:MFS transporter [Alteromonadaceae bacterium]